MPSTSLTGYGPCHPSINRNYQDSKESNTYIKSTGTCPLSARPIHHHQSRSMTPVPISYILSYYHHMNCQNLADKIFHRCITLIHDDTQNTTPQSRMHHIHDNPYPTISPIHRPFSRCVSLCTDTVFFITLFVFVNAGAR